MRSKLSIFIFSLIIILGFLRHSEGLSLSFNTYIQMSLATEQTVVIGFRKNLTQEDILRFCKDYQVKLTRPIDKYHVYGFILPRNKGLLNTIIQDSRVEYVLPDFRLEDNSITTQTQTESSVLNEIRQKNEQFLKQIGLWNLEGIDAIKYISNGQLRGNGKVIVAVIESSGFSEFLINQLNQRLLLIQNKKDITKIMGSRSHGTNVLSLIAAVLPDNIYLMPTKYDGMFSGLIDSVALALKEAERKEAKIVVNISGNVGTQEFIMGWLSYFRSNGYSEDEARQLAEAFSEISIEQYRNNSVFEEYAQDAVLVAAVGNRPKAEIAFPAGYPNVIGVGATYNNNLTSYSPYGDWVDIYAPGGEDLPGKSMYVLGLSGELEERTGTSLSAPLVSTISGLIYLEEPDLTPQEVRKIITTTSSRLFVQEKEAYLNQIDALEAVKTTRAYSGIKDMRKAFEGYIRDSELEVGITNNSSLVNPMLITPKIAELRKSFNAGLNRIFSENRELLEQYREDFDLLFIDFSHGNLDSQEAKLRLNQILADVWTAVKDQTPALTKAIALGVDFMKDKNALAKIILSRIPELNELEAETIIEYTAQKNPENSVLNNLLALDTAYTYKGISEALEIFSNDMSKGETKESFDKALERIFHRSPELRDIYRDKFESLFDQAKNNVLSKGDSRREFVKTIWEVGEADRILRLGLIGNLTQLQDGSLLTELIKEVTSLSQEQISSTIDYLSQKRGGEFDALEALKLTQGYKLWDDIIQTFDALTIVFPEDIKTTLANFWNDFMKSPDKLEAQFDVLLKSLGFSEKEIAEDPILNSYKNEYAPEYVQEILKLKKENKLSDEVKADFANNILKTVLIEAISSPLGIDFKVKILNTEKKILSNLNKLLGPAPVNQSILLAINYAATALEIGIMNRKQASEYLAEAIPKYSLDGKEVISLWQYLNIKKTPILSEQITRIRGVVFSPEFQFRYKLSPFSINSKSQNFNLQEIW